MELPASAEDLGRAITYLRGDRTQAAVAKSAGLTAATWSLYEAGRRKPRSENLAKVLRGLSCTQLELEETTWRFRRRRLLAQLSPATTNPRSARNQLQSPAGLQAEARAGGSHPADPRLRAVLARLNAVLEDFFLLVYEVQR